MTETQKFQRRTVLVKRSLQLKYIGMVFLSVLASSLLLLLDVYWSMARPILIDNPGLAQQVGEIHAIVLVKLGLCLVIMLLISLYVSHRFAGPIYRFEKSAQIAASGDLTNRVCLRTGDELAELQDEFNGMLASLQALVQKDRTLVSRLSAKLEAAANRLPEGGTTRAELESIKIELSRITRSFKV